MKLGDALLAKHLDDIALVAVNDTADFWEHQGFIM